MTELALCLTVFDSNQPSNIDRGVKKVNVNLYLQAEGWRRGDSRQASLTGRTG